MLRFSGIASQRLAEARRRRYLNGQVGQLRQNWARLTMETVLNARAVMLDDRF